MSVQDALLCSVTIRKEEVDTDNGGCLRVDTGVSVKLAAGQSVEAGQS